MSETTIKTGPDERDVTVFTDQQMARKVRREFNHAVRHHHSNRRCAWDPVGYLLGREFREVVHRAGLSPSQMELLNLLMAGVPQVEIAKRAGVRPSAVAARVARLRLKLERAWQEYPYAGLWEVYRDETENR